MEQITLREVEARCTQEALPKCRAKCPLRLDVRAFMEKMAAGEKREARKTLEKHLPLPGILARICDHPCEDVCLRKDLGGSLAIGWLEKWCVDNVEQQTRPLPRPKKSSTVAVLGSGLAGLVAAFELARKGFPVTVYGAGKRGDWLEKRFAGLDEKAREEELNSLEKAGAQFLNATIGMELFEKAQKEAAGIFIDADEGEILLKAMGLSANAATGIVCEARKIVAGGWLSESPTGAKFASASKQAGEGRRAAVSLERMLNGVSSTAERKGEMEEETKLFTNIAGIQPVATRLPAGNAYTNEEAAEEAQRCLRCECMACVKQCVYLQKHGAYPRVYARQIYNNAAIVQGQHIGNPLINGCALCGQCTEICPERFSMAEVCLNARQDMVKRDKMPPSAHEFALEDMADACGPESSFFYRGGGENCAWAFWPGCQLGASAGNQVIAVYEHLQGTLKGGVGLFVHCCGVPAHWAGREKTFAAVKEKIAGQWQAASRPKLIVACAYCEKMFKEFLPEIECVSLWEVLDEGLCVKSAPFAGKVFSVHDPCAARNNKPWQAAVRSLAHKAEAVVEEPPFSGSLTACCGYGGLVWNARPEIAEAMAQNRAEQLEHPALVSCAMCRDRLRQSGKEAWHILDVLNLAQEKADHTVPGFSARRRNRAALHKKCAEKYGFAAGRTSAEEKVLITPELLTQLEKKHILQQDAEEAVQKVEEGKQVFVEARSGHKVGSWRPGNVTFWVRYSHEGENFRLHDAWVHRMRVPGSGNN